jgi:hypothetical protein
LLYLRTGEFEIEKNHLNSLKIKAEFYAIPDLSKKIEQIISDNNKINAIKNNEAKKKIYHLLNQSKFDRTSNADIGQGLGHSYNRRAIAWNLQLISMCYD